MCPEGSKIRSWFGFFLETFMEFGSDYTGNSLKFYQSQRTSLNYQLFGFARGQSSLFFNKCDARGHLDRQHFSFFNVQSKHLTQTNNGRRTKAKSANVSRTVFIEYSSCEKNLRIRPKVPSICKRKSNWYKHSTKLIIFQKTTNWVNKRDNNHEIL